MKKQGFTLVELLVVVLIIGILSSVALPQYQKAVNKARGAEVLTAMNALAKAMNMAYLEDGNYKRSYYGYSGYMWGGSGHVNADDFDIEVPALKYWSLWAPSAGNRASRTIEASYSIGLTPHSDPMGGNPTLVYHLSQGKISSITCSGSKCREFFPASILSSN